VGNIKAIYAREILDSRGNPTLQVRVELQDGTIGVASVPSGASVGVYEALELRDNDPRRFRGRGVLKAVNKVREIIAPAIKGMPALDQEAIDRRLIELDGTPNKANLGANSLLGVSLAVAHAAANYSRLPLYAYLGGEGVCLLPIPFMNIINAGKHALGVADFQEYMIVPIGETFGESLRMGVEIYYALKEILQDKGLNIQVGDEGGFAPILSSNKQGIELLLQAIEAAGYNPGGDCFIALDIAASQFYKHGTYSLQKDGQTFTSLEIIKYYEELADYYPIISIEDGLGEEDWGEWQLLMQRLGDRMLIVGDDLYATNKHRLATGIESRASNAILIKPNQIGTLTETITCVRMAQQAGWKAVISHRSGETEDVSIADLAVGLSAGLIKVGAPCRSERVAKYNRLLIIEEELGEKAEFAGFRFLEKILKRR
jgi:enolase